MRSGSIGDWAAASEAQLTAGNGVHCNGHQSEDSFSTANSRRSGRNENTAPYTRFDNMDATALAVRLTQADGAVAQFQAVGVSTWLCLFRYLRLCQASSISAAVSCDFSFSALDLYRLVLLPKPALRPFDSCLAESSIGLLSAPMFHPAFFVFGVSHATVTLAISRVGVHSCIHTEILSAASTGSRDVAKVAGRPLCS